MWVKIFSDVETYIIGFLPVISPCDSCGKYGLKLLFPCVLCAWSILLFLYHHVSHIVWILDLLHPKMWKLTILDWRF